MRKKGSVNQVYQEIGWKDGGDGRQPVEMSEERCVTEKALLNAFRPLTFPVPTLGQLLGGGDCWHSQGEDEGGEREPHLCRNVSRMEFNRVVRARILTV
jgi:hypothetical protein